MKNISHDTIDALSDENRKFPPSEAFKAKSLVTGTFLYDQAAEDDEAFWARQASSLVDWAKPWDTVLEWDLPDAKWFVGGELNVAYNCLDRHVLGGKGDKVAIHWEGEPGDTRTITYQQLLDEVSQFANVLKDARCPARRPRRTSTSRWFPRPPSRCSHVPASVRRTASCSVASPPQSLVGSHQRRRGQGAHHRGRRLSPRHRVRAQAGRRRGLRRYPHDRARRGRQARRQRRRHGRRA